MTCNIILFPTRSAQVPVAGQQFGSGNTISSQPYTMPKIDISDEERRENAFLIVQTVLTFAKRKGRSLSSLQPQLRKWLLELCAQGDPTAKAVHDWLTGNQRYAVGGVNVHSLEPLSRTDRGSAAGGEGA